MRTGGEEGGDKGGTGGAVLVSVVMTLKSFTYFGSVIYDDALAWHKVIWSRSIRVYSRVDICADAPMFRSSSRLCSLFCFMAARHETTVSQRELMSLLSSAFIELLASLE